MSVGFNLNAWQDWLERQGPTASWRYNPSEFASYGGNGILSPESYGRNAAGLSGTPDGGVAYLGVEQKYPYQGGLAKGLIQSDQARDLLDQIAQTTNSRLNAKPVAKTVQPQDEKTDYLQMLQNLFDGGA